MPGLFFSSEADLPYFCLDWVMFAEWLTTLSSTYATWTPSSLKAGHISIKQCSWLGTGSCTTRLLCQGYLALLAVVFLSCTTLWHGEFLSAFPLSLTDVRPAFLQKAIHASGMVLQVFLSLLWTNHCPLGRWTLHLKLNTIQFSAYLITWCSNFLVIWWHAPVIAYISTIMLQHKLQQEFNKYHWVSLHLVLLSAQKDKHVFVFSVFHLSICPSRRWVPTAFSAQAVSELKPLDL